MIWVEPYETMVTPASSSNFGTNTAAEAGGVFKWNKTENLQETVPYTATCTAIFRKWFSRSPTLHSLLPHSDKLIHCFVKFLIVLLLSLLLCFCTVL